MAAPVFQSAGTTGQGGSGSVSVGKPASVAAGDLLVIMAVSYDVDTDASIAVTGFTRRAQAIKTGSAATVVSLFDRVADGSEGSSFTISGSASIYVSGVCIRITGADGSAPYDTSSTNSGSGTAATATGISAASADEILVLFHGGYGNGLSVGYDGSMQQRVNWDSNVSYVYTKELGASGSTGNFAATLAGSDSWAVVLAGYKAAAGGGGGSAIAAIQNSYRQRRV
jgi:hypothetical protein